MCLRVKPAEEVCPQAHLVRNQEAGLVQRAGTVRCCYNMSSQLIRALGVRHLVHWPYPELVDDS
jgi:hypothetical protein